MKNMNLLYFEYLGIRYVYEIAVENSSVWCFKVRPIFVQVIPRSTSSLRCLRNRYFIDIPYPRPRCAGAGKVRCGVRWRVRFTCGQDFTRTSEWQNICGNFQSYIEQLNKLFKIDRAIQKDSVMNEYSFEYSFIGSNLYSISLTWFSVFRLLLEVDVFAVPDCIVLSTCHSLSKQETSNPFC